MMKLLYCLSLTATMLGCDTSVNSGSPPDYTILQKLGCFCPGSGVWVNLTVRADTVADAFTVSDHVRLSDGERKRYKSVKDLFEVISQTDTSVFDLRYIIDSVYNYPSYVYFNPKSVVHGDTASVILDAQMAYTTRNYVPLR